MSEADFLNLVHCLIFANEYRFDDEEEVRRFLTMITQAVSEKELDNVSGYEILASHCEQLELAKDKLTSDNNRLTSNNDQLVQKIKEYEEVIEQKNKEIEELKEKNRILMGK